MDRQTDKGCAWLRSCLYIRLKLYFILLAKSRFSQMAAKHKLIRIKNLDAEEQIRRDASSSFTNFQTTRPSQYTHNTSDNTDNTDNTVHFQTDWFFLSQNRRTQQLQSGSTTVGAKEIQAKLWSQHNRGESTKSGEHVPYLRSCHAAEWDAQDGTKWWSGTLASRSPCRSPLESRPSRFSPPGSWRWTTVAWRVDSTHPIAVANRVDQWGSHAPHCFYTYVLITGFFFLKLSTDIVKKGSVSC